MSRNSTSTASELAPAARLETLPQWTPDLTLGHEAAGWAHRWLIQPNGPRHGEPFELTWGQYLFLLHWYAIDENGDWLYSRAVRRLAKGSGKSPFAAVLCLIEFLAPVRLLDFDRFADGGCRGRPVDMPLVQIAATAESQTANTMRMVRAFAPKKSELVAAHNIDAGKVQYYKIPEGTLEVITSSATASEGAESTFVVEDETEHWLPNNGGIELDSTIADNLAKSGARLLETSNAWTPGAGSVAEASWDSWLLQEEGRTKGETKTLYDARLAPPDTDMADADSLRAGLEWVYGDCDWKKPDPDSPPDVRSQMERIWDPRSQPDESARKYLNWPTSPRNAWTTPEAWALLYSPTRAVEPDEEIVAFFDGSKSRDATALIGCCVSDGHVFTIGIWQPDPAEPGDEVDVREVDDRVAWMKDTYTVCAFFGDVREWESFTKVAWPDLFGDELEIMAVPGGKTPQAVAWDMRTKEFEFTVEVELTLAEIEGQEFTHDGDSRMGQHVANARRRANRHGISIAKESPDSRLKIDAAVCVVGARMVRRRLLADRLARKPKKQAGPVRGW